eukprot:m.282512 g.282512  ORF g.282512 m.282512 type:complete len:1408 (+) comp17751_c0_seq1:124-4347(+)
MAAIQYSLMLLMGVGLLLLGMTPGTMAASCGSDDCSASQACCCPDSNISNCFCCTGGCDSYVWSSWTPLTSCTASCGGGSRSVKRTCETVPFAQQNTCPVVDPAATCTSALVDAEESKFESCNSECCPIVSTWSAWSSYTTCSATCGGGTQDRTRTCTPSACPTGTVDCDGEALNANVSETRACNSDCCQTDTQWSVWGAWSTCSSPCSTGTRSRSRSCTASTCPTGVSTCGDPDDVDTDTEACGPTPAGDGTWSAWNAWSGCSATCGAGVRTRTQTCSLAQCGGQQLCPSPSNTRSETSDCTPVPPACPVNGGWSQWAQAGSCSVTCGTGTATFSRTCQTPSAGGVVNCNGLTPGASQSATRACDTNQCCPVSSQWSAWSSLGSCSVTCGVGVYNRTRTCQSAQCGGLNVGCSGQAVSAQDARQFVCDTGLCCPVNSDYVYSGWTLWSAACSTRTRSRTVVTCPATCGGSCPLTPSRTESEDIPCIPNNTPSNAITVTLRFNIPSFGVLPSHIAVVTAGLQSQLETELGSTSAVSDAQAIATTGTDTSVTLTFEFDLVASQFGSLSTADYKCEATCAVRSMVEKEAVVTQVQQATLFGNTSQITVQGSLISCDCEPFASQRDGSTAGPAGSKSDNTVMYIAIGAAVGAVLVILVIFIILRRRQASVKSTGRPLPDDTYDDAHRLTGLSMSESMDSDVVGIPTDEHPNMTISNPLFRSNSISMTKPIKGKASGMPPPLPSSHQGGNSFEEYIYSNRPDTPEDSPYRSMDAESAYQQGRQGQRRASRQAQLEATQEEPMLVLLQDRRAMLVLKRTEPGCYRPLDPIYRTRHTVKEAAIARKPQGGYVFLRNSPPGDYHAVRSSAREDELMVVQTLMDTAVLLVKKHDQGFSNVTDFERVEPAAVAVPTDPSLGEMLIIVLHSTEVSDPTTVGTCSILKRVTGTKFEPVATTAMKEPSEVGVELKSGTVVTLHRLQDGSYVKMANNEPSNGLVAQSLTLPPMHYKEVLTTQLAEDGHDRLVTLLQAGHQDSDYRVIERHDGGLYQPAKLADKAVANMAIQTSDGGYIRLHRAEDGYTRISQGQLDESLDESIDTTYLEILTATDQAGQEVSLVQGETGDYAVLARDRDGLYTRPDTGEEYMSRAELEQLVKLHSNRNSPSLTQSNTDGITAFAPPPSRGGTQRPSVTHQSAMLSAIDVEDLPITPVAVRQPSRSSRPKRVGFQPLPDLHEDEREPGLSPLALSPHSYTEISPAQPARSMTRQDSWTAGRRSLGYIAVTPEAEGLEMLTGDHLGRRQSVSGFVGMRRSSAPAVQSAAMTAADAHAILEGNGCLAGSFVLQRINGTNVWLHVAHGRDIHTVQIYLDPQFQGPVELLDNGNFFGPSLDRVMARFGQDTSGLPCPLGMNMTPQ